MGFKTEPRVRNLVKRLAKRRFFSDGTPSDLFDDTFRTRISIERRQLWSDRCELAHGRLQSYGPEKLSDLCVARVISGNTGMRHR
jgi:hypothetical protein